MNNSNAGCLPLPEGWASSTLYNIGDYANGRAFKSSDWSATGRPIIRIQDLTHTKDNPNYYEGSVEDCHIVRPGDFLISWSATLGAFIWDGPEGVLNQHIFKVNSYIDKFFHKYLVEFIINELKSQTHGSGMVHVTKEMFENTSVLVPPLAEQNRISAKLDNSLLLINAIKQRLDKASLIIKRFRQAILRAACSGKLTEDWRSNQILFVHDPQLESIVTPPKKYTTQISTDRAETRFNGLPEIPAEWIWAKLPDLGSMSRGKSRHRPRNAPHLLGGPYPFIQTGDIAQSQGRIINYIQTYSEAGLAQSRLWPAGTVCITIAANIANSAILMIPACFPDSVVGLIADENICINEYIEYFIRTARTNLDQFAPATAQKNINIEILNEVNVPLPSVPEQQEIIQRVSALFQFADAIEEHIAATITRADKLTQSILTKAFRGELVSTEAELARQEDRSYEPASVLLERIQEQKKTVVRAKKRKK